MLNKIFYNNWKLSFNFGGDFLKSIICEVVNMELSLIVLFVILGFLILLLISFLIFGLVIRSLIKKVISGKVSYVDNRVGKQDNKFLVLDNAIKSAENLKSELNDRILKLKAELNNQVLSLNNQEVK